jgi:hypothetical protein
MHGTWQTTGGRSTRVVLLIGGILLMAGCGGAAAFLADVLIAAGVILILGIGAMIALLVHRVRATDGRGGLEQRIVPAPVRYELPGPERPAIPQHVHFHFDGADPAAVAEILRRHQAE